MLVFCRGVLSRYHCKWTSYQCTNLELIQPYQRAFVQRYKKVSACDCFLMMLRDASFLSTSDYFKTLCVSYANSDVKAHKNKKSMTGLKKI